MIFEESGESESVGRKTDIRVRFVFLLHVNKNLARFCLFVTAMSGDANFQKGGWRKNDLYVGIQLNMRFCDVSKKNLHPAIISFLSGWGSQASYTLLFSIGFHNTEIGKDSAQMLEGDTTNRQNAGE